MSDDLDELIEAMTVVMDRMQVREVEHRVRILEDKRNLISDRAFLCWKKGDLQFFLCEHPIHVEGRRVKQENPELYNELSIYKTIGRYNGYVRFPSLPMIVPGHRGILTYVPVHGGITYFQDWWDGSVTYGFDVGHIVSEKMLEIINDIGWMMTETESMARGIQIASRFERYYLNANTEQRKAVVLDRMGKFLPLAVGDNFGAMVNVMFGDL